LTPPGHKPIPTGPTRPPARSTSPADGIQHGGLGGRRLTRLAHGRVHRRAVPCLVHRRCSCRRSEPGGAVRQRRLPGLAVRHRRPGATCPFGVDLYALPARATGDTVLPADYYGHAATLTPARPCCRPPFYVPGMTNGTGAASARAGHRDLQRPPTPSLVGLPQYRVRLRRRAPGSWIFLRLSPATNVFSWQPRLFSPLTPAAGETWARPLHHASPPPLDTNAPPAQTNNQTLRLVFPVQGLAYAKLNVSPLPVSRRPRACRKDVGTPSVVNPSAPVTYLYTYPAQHHGDQWRRTSSPARSRTPTSGSARWTTTARRLRGGVRFSTLALDGSTWSVEVYSVTTTNATNSHSAASSPTRTRSCRRWRSPGRSRWSSPADQAMITTTRRPSR
jgi:hypothetical protein